MQDSTQEIAKRLRLSSFSSALGVPARNRFYLFEIKFHEQQFVRTCEQEDSKIGCLNNFSRHFGFYLLEDPYKMLDAQTYKCSL